MGIHPYVAGDPYAATLFHLPGEISYFCKANKHARGNIERTLAIDDIIKMPRSGTKCPRYIGPLLTP